MLHYGSRLRSVGHLSLITCDYGSKYGTYRLNSEGVIDKKESQVSLPKGQGGLQFKVKNI
jgi:hypothetical protein